MKCDLCSQPRAKEELLLCRSCAEMVQRLIAIGQGPNAGEACEAERLAASDEEARSTASGLGF